MGAVVHLTERERRALAVEIRDLVFQALDPIVQRSAQAEVCECCYGRAESVGLLEVFAAGAAIASVGSADPDTTMAAFVDVVKAACAVALAQERIRDHQRRAELAAPIPPKDRVH